MNKKADINWYIISMVLALTVLIILIIIFREQIAHMARNFGFLTPNETVLKNATDCLTNPNNPACSV